MPPRSKQSKVEWVTCSDCGCMFSNKDQECHNESCSKTPSLCHIQHGFIKGEKLFGIIHNVNEGKSEDVPCGDDVILCHPGSMKLCKMFIGGRVTVGVHQGGDAGGLPQGGHGGALKVCQVWPCQSLPLTGIALTPEVQAVLQDQPQSHVVVQRLPSPHQQAKCLVLLPRNQKEYFTSKEFTQFFKHYYDKKFVKSGDLLKMNYYGQPCEVTVSEVKCYLETDLDNQIDSVTTSMKKLNLAHQFYEITSSTSITMSVKHGEATDSSKKFMVTLDELGGLSKQVEMLKELIELQLLKPQSTWLGDIGLPKSILLYGPSGTGKTMLAQAICHWSGLHVTNITASNIWSKYYGETEGKIAQIFSEAEEKSPSIILMDEIDALCGRRQSSQSDVEKRVISALLTSIDSLIAGPSRVMILAVTSRPDDLDPSLRRPGRFDREVEVPVPTAPDRVQILQKLVQKVPNSLKNADIETFASKCHGYVGADLAALCREAVLHAVKQGKDTEVTLTCNDLAHGLQNTKPSAMREVALEVPQVSWDDIGGQADIKHKLRQAIEWPLKHPEAFLRLGIRPPRGLLMYGPPGCSKTMIAKALAHDSGVNFISIKGPELFSKWVGESERAVREVFRKARAAAPAIVFFDEIDALAGQRGGGRGGSSDVGDRVLAQLLTEIDGVDALKDVTIVAATNRPDRIDKALLRPGRLDRIVYVPLPDSDTRREIFAIQMKKTPTAEDVDEQELVSLTEGYSGAEVIAVCYEAALSAMQEDITIAHVHRRHFQQALQVVTPRITQDLLQFYDSYHTDSGLHAL